MQRDDLALESQRAHRATSQGSFPAYEATLPLRWGYPQLPVNLVPLVGDRFSLSREPLVFLMWSRKAIGTTEYFVPPEPVGVNGDRDVSICRLRGRKLFHMIAFS